MAIFMSLSINTLTILDLYVTLRNPFESTGNRPQKLFLIASVSAIFFGTVCMIETGHTDHFAPILQPESLFTIVIIFNGLCAIIVMSLVYFRLNKAETGTST